MARHSLGMRRRQVLLCVLGILMAVVAPLGGASESSATGDDVPRLAFADGRAVRVVAADGSAERTLAVAGTPLAPPVGWDDVRTPSWSPDGRRVAFSRSFGMVWLAPSTEVRTVGTEGAGDTTVVSLPGAGIIEELRWSPTADRLAFALFTPNPAGIATWGLGSRWNLYVVNAGGDGLRLVAPLHGAQARGLDWSPDGTSLTFISDELGVPGVYTISVDGVSLPTRLTPIDLAAADPRWSPDGRHIAFRGATVLAAGEVLPTSTRLWTVAAGGGDLRALPATTGEAPAWSPDSLWLAYAPVGETRASASSARTAATAGCSPPTIARAITARCGPGTA